MYLQLNDPLRVKIEGLLQFETHSCCAVMQVGFGSGFKCNSAVWKAMRNIHDTEHVEWMHMKNGNLERCWNYVQVQPAPLLPPLTSCLSVLRGLAGH